MAEVGTHLGGHLGSYSITIVKMRTLNKKKGRQYNFNVELNHEPGGTNPLAPPLHFLQQ